MNAGQERYEFRGKRLVHLKGSEIRGKLIREGLERMKADGRHNGPPSKFADETINVLLENIARGMPLRAAAEYAGITYETMRQWQRKDEDGELAYYGFSAAVARAKRERARNLLDMATVQAEHDGKLALRLLELSDPHNFAPTFVQRVETELTVRHEYNVPNIGINDRQMIADLILRPQLPAPAEEQAPISQTNDNDKNMGPATSSAVNAGVVNANADGSYNADFTEYVGTS